MQPFTAASHHDVLVLLVQLAVLLLSARALGELARRTGQPSVLGELAAGILLGPSLLSTLAPALGVWIVPQTPVQGYLLEGVALLGAMFLLLITGLETDIGLIRRHARTAIGVSWGGILVTFSTGFLLGAGLPDALLGDPAQRLVFSLFVATAMSISAIPVIAKVLIDLDLIRRDVGQTIIAAGMNDDTVGWILLSIVAGLASGQSIGAGRIALIVGSVLGFLLFSITIGRWLVRAALDFVQDRVVSPHRTLTLVVTFMFGWAAITQALQLEAVLGAFVIGILFGQVPRAAAGMRDTIEGIAFGVFTPIFFAVAGLKVDLHRLAEPRLIVIALLVIAVATVGKVAGTYLGARWIGRTDHWRALCFGAALNARGAMEIIVATIGLNLGILSQDMFSIIVLMAMATSFMTPFALRWILARVTPDAEEARRLEQETLARGSLIAGLHRVLVPVRQRKEEPGDAQSMEATILERLATRTSLTLTLLTVAPVGERAAGVSFLQRVAGRFTGMRPVRKVVESAHAGNAILDEAKKGYDLILLGAAERETGAATLFTPLIDYVVGLSDCPTIVVRARPWRASWSPRRILVPTNGSVAARRAAELAFALAGGEEDEVLLLQVVTSAETEHHLDLTGEVLERQLTIAHRVVDELRQLGELGGVRTHGLVRQGPVPEKLVLDAALAKEVDLIVVGASVRGRTGQLFLGARVEHILNHAPCPVIALNI